MIKALYDQDILPRILVGSSVGAVLAVFICSHQFDRLYELLDVDIYQIKMLKIKDQEGEGRTLGGIIRMILRDKSFLSSDSLASFMR